MNTQNKHISLYQLPRDLSELSRTMVFPRNPEGVSQTDLSIRYMQDQIALTVADEAGFSLLRERLVEVGFVFARARGRLESWPRFTLTAEHPTLRGQVRFLLLATSLFDRRCGRLEVYATKQGLLADFLTEGPYNDPATYDEIGAKLISLVKRHSS